MIFRDLGPTGAATKQDLEVQFLLTKSGLAPRPERCKDWGLGAAEKAHGLLLLILPATSYWLGNASLLLPGRRVRSNAPPENFDSSNFD